MKKAVVLLAVAVSLVLLVACGGGGSETDVGEDVLGSDSAGFGGFAPGAPRATPSPFPALAAALAIETEGSRLPSTTLETAERKVISGASLSVEVEMVQEAVTQVRVIAESLGGFVEQLSSSGDSDRERATMTIRVPQDQFFSTLERIKELGKVRSENVGSEDVSEQFIDLEPRLNSALREEQSLLSLLEKAETVSEILTIERELFRVRSEIERLQGQLNFLERRVELATITVSLFPPKTTIAEPPSVSLTVEVSDVTGSVDEIKALVSTLDGSVDGVFLSVRDGREKAEVALRVFTSDFERAVRSIEGQGEVRSKELQQRTVSAESETEPAEEPDAHIFVSLIEGEKSSSTGLIVAIVAPIGGVGLALILGSLFYLTYRMGGRKGSAS